MYEENPWKQHYINTNVLLQAKINQLNTFTVKSWRADLLITTQGIEDEISHPGAQGKPNIGQDISSRRRIC